MKDVPPNHRLVVPLLSIVIHPEARDMSLQGGIPILAIHFPHIVAQNLGFQLKQQFQSNDSLSSQPTQPKELDPLLFHIVSHDIPLHSRDPSQGWHEISQLGTLGIINCSKSAYNSLLKSLWEIFST
jgi:hypothetical protein